MGFQTPVVVEFTTSSGVALPFQSFANSCFQAQFNHVAARINRAIVPVGSQQHPPQLEIGTVARWHGPPRDGRPLALHRIAVVTRIPAESQLNTKKEN